MEAKNITISLESTKKVTQTFFCLKKSKHLNAPKTMLCVLSFQVQGHQWEFAEGRHCGTRRTRLGGRTAGSLEKFFFFFFKGEGRLMLMFCLFYLKSCLSVFFVFCLGCLFFLLVRVCVCVCAQSVFQDSILALATAQFLKTWSSAWFIISAVTLELVYTVELVLFCCCLPCLPDRRTSRTRMPLPTDTTEADQRLNEKQEWRWQMKA